MCINTATPKISFLKALETHWGIIHSKNWRNHIRITLSKKQVNIQSRFNKASLLCFMFFVVVAVVIVVFAEFVSTWIKISKCKIWSHPTYKFQLQILVSRRSWFLSNLWNTHASVNHYTFEECQKCLFYFWKKGIAETVQ